MSKPQPLSNEPKPVDTSKGQALYEKAKRLLPGGTQLLSKRPEQYAPGQWPPYYVSAKGATVTLSVAKGPPQLFVPDVTGQTQADATAALESSGFLHLGPDGTGDAVPDQNLARNQAIADQITSLI